MKFTKKNKTNLNKTRKNRDISLIKKINKEFDSQLDTKLVSKLSKEFKTRMVHDSTSIPSLFNKWDKLWFDDVAPPSEDELNLQKNIRDKIAKRLKELGFNTNLSGMSSPWVGMNFLSLDKETVMVDERQINLIKFLESKKFKVITTKMRHMYTQGGGIHCATLDTVRDSVYESYF